MGERSGAPETEADAAKLSLQELNGWIARAEFMASHLKRAASLKKSAMKRLVWLEPSARGFMACLPRIVAGSDCILMSKKPHRPPQARPRLVDRIQLARSTGRHLDGIWIGCWRGRPEDLTRVEGALLLIKQHSPLDYARITRELERVWLHLLPHGLGAYNHSLRACVLDERYVADPATTVEQIASTIVHEATHARLERCGIEYEEQRRARIEAICFRRELAFAVRLPDSAELQEGIARCLEWYANPEHFSDAHFQEAHAAGAIEALRHLGSPGWFVKAFSLALPIVSRARSLFRFQSR
ncbi:hypothetical protein ACH79_11280 [Bradyrhizobium sp. CCBAU 051011]|uniref:hypothetical protein n=1 Tax=Bradyrhizobium sp. CCBAU 051011 TaxID=858422 RepID=UPI00137437FC|nr:hypothetical protein [Bradyrhizobium sp. CCBAU 051011]QHO73138.1 hypothetical protein ACH79_11280 [Bradyrhizobium sp. CCBAU 051011]